MAGRTDGCDYNIPFSFLKKRGDTKYCLTERKSFLIFFNQFQLILLGLIVPKMKKVVTKYVVCYSNN